MHLSFRVVDAIDAGEMVDLKLTISGEIGRHYSQHDIAFTSHEVAFHGFWKWLTLLNESLNSLKVLAGEPNSGIGGKSFADLCGNKQGNVTPNNSSVLQCMDSSDTSGRGKVHGIREFIDDSIQAEVHA
ncbi:hypothetical protein HMPREF2526_07025 [Corynebacterium sp. HMSC070E08]|nr:hypothetical protein HMPREF2526_07025 [Corynebacterium sp. HMSC070E08]